MIRMQFILFMLLLGCGKEDARQRECVQKGENCSSPADSPSPGPRGVPGTAGKDGKSCTVLSVSNGAFISCTDGTGVVIFNGAKGETGESAPPTSYTVTEMIDPCGKQGTYDEILLRLANRQLIAHYASGAQQFLTVIGPGSYTTTDGTGCLFTVDNNLEVSW